MVTASRPAWLAHAHVECRVPGGEWWRYARPFLAHDARLLRLIAGGGADGRTFRTDLPSDVSWAVLDDYTLRVVGEFVAPGPRTLSPEDADAWVASGVATLWPTREPWARITDPANEYPTTLTAGDLAACLAELQRRRGESPPATYRALRAMVGELETAYQVRVLLWFERLSPLALETPPQRPRHGRGHTPGAGTETVHPAAVPGVAECPCGASVRVGRAREAVGPAAGRRRSPTALTARCPRCDAALHVPQAAR